MGIHDLTRKILDTKTLANEALKYVCYQPNLQISQIENFFREQEIVERHHDNIPTRAGLKAMENTALGSRGYAVMQATSDTTSQVTNDVTETERESERPDPEDIQSDVPHSGETDDEEDEQGQKRKFYERKRNSRGGKGRKGEKGNRGKGK